MLTPAAVLEALGRLGDARAFQPVAAHLDDKDKDVQQSALEAVAHVGDESVIEKLVMTLVDGHAGVRQAAGRALTRLDPNWEQSERVQVLLPQIQAAMKNRDSGVQTAATNLLKRITGRSALEALEIAERAEAERQQNATSFVLQELLRDWDPDLRLAAAESIARLKLAECVGALKASVRDPDQWVRAAARSALDSLASAAG